MPKRPRINSIRVASTDKDMKYGIYIKGKLIATGTEYRWSAALSTNHLPTLGTYLQDAINSEQYEFAAEIRDRIKEVKNIKPIIGPDIETVDVPY